LRKACKRHHGVALRPFVKLLLSDLRRATRRVKTYMAKFMLGVDTRRLTGRWSMRPYLDYAGGARRLTRILPYMKKDVMRDHAVL
jgi:hypothetical protein